jgi:hypothetical protein
MSSLFYKLLSLNTKESYSPHQYGGAPLEEIAGALDAVAAVPPADGSSSAKASSAKAPDANAPEAATPEDEILGISGKPSPPGDPWRYKIERLHVQYIMLFISILVSLVIFKYISKHIIVDGLFETDDTDDNKKKRAMVVLTTSFIITIILCYTLINILVLGGFGMSATEKEREFMDGVKDWLKYFVKDEKQSYIEGFVFVIGIVVVLGIIYLFYTTLIDKTYYDDIYFKTSIIINENKEDGEPSDIEEKSQSHKYLFHYSFFLIAVSVFVLSYTSFYSGLSSIWYVIHSLLIFFILPFYLCFSFLSLSNLYVNLKAKMLLYFCLQIAFTIIYIFILNKKLPN